ncbi:MAG: amidohydrolase [Thermotogaceae bacterium]|nr:amidohydrolase [Mesotoga sp.]MDI9374935.1 amidohydrolase [Thermotogota bacterium]NLX34591.1 amidohydrolase [Thermotogaceae bacterium]MDD4039597.1 amidohydrolase [Mesotoga sp.]MDD5745151.1 amidohydrolase [Mesotoga sp.]
MSILLKNGTIYPITSKPFAGDILVSKGKIESIGVDLKCEGAEVIDASGKYIFPGFIDAHSHIGLFEEGVGGYYQDGNEMTDPLTPDVSVVDAFSPQDAAIKRALSGGVTTVMVVPGSANPIGGQGAIFKFKNTMIVDDMVVRAPAGLKMATGENPKRVYGEGFKKTPGTRLGTAAVIRGYFQKVQGYMEKKAIVARDGKSFTEIDPKLEIGEKVLRKEIPARIHAHRLDDILTAVRLSKEFDFKLVIEHATEGYKIVDYLKENNVPVVIGPIFGFRTKLELKDMTYDSPRIMNEKGVLAAFMCDHPVIPLESTNIQLGVALRYGSKEEDLLKMVTINPAKILEIDDRVGSLEVGKDADIAVWSGHPFQFSSRVEMVFIEGEEVYNSK